MSDRCPDSPDEPIFNGLLVALMMGRRVALLVGMDHEERSRLTDRLAGHMAAGGAMVLRTVACPGMSVEDLLLASNPGLHSIAAVADAVEAELDAAGLGVLIIDEAQRLSAATRRDLFELAATDSDTGRFLQVLLAGTPDLERRLANPDLAAIFRLPEPKRSGWRPPARSWRWAGAAVLAMATGLGAGAALLPETESASIDSPPLVAVTIDHAALPETDLEAEYGLVLLPEAELGPDPAPPAPPTPPIPSHKPPPPSRPVTKQPPKPAMASLSPPPATRSADEDECRRGPGGAQAPDASLAGIAQGFTADLRSLGRCVGGLLGR